MGWLFRDEPKKSPWENHPNAIKHRKKGSPFKDHPNAKAENKALNSERVRGAVLHICHHDTKKVIKKKVRGTNSEIREQMADIRQSLGGNCNVTIHTWTN